MTNTLAVPATKCGTKSGSPRFQLAYITNDIERAMEVFAERYGVTEWRRREGMLKEGGQIRVELGWADGALLEVTQASGPGSELYCRGLPANEFTVLFQHLGYFIPDEEAWEALLAEIAAGKIKVFSETNVPGLLQAKTVEAPDLGLHIEYIFPEPGAIAAF